MENQTQTPETEEHGEESAPIKAIRDQLKAEQKARKALEAKLQALEPEYQKFVVEKAGFDPESPQATALLKLHESDEFTVEALAKTAQEYGLAPAASEEGGQSAKPELTAEEQQAIASSQRGAQQAATASPSNPQTAQQRYAEAEQAGDLQAMIAAQEQIAKEWKQRQGA